MCQSQSAVHSRCRSPSFRHHAKEDGPNIARSAKVRFAESRNTNTSQLSLPSFSAISAGILTCPSGSTMLNGVPVFPRSPGFLDGSPLSCTESQSLRVCRRGRRHVHAITVEIMRTNMLVSEDVRSGGLYPVGPSTRSKWTTWKSASSAEGYSCKASDGWRGDPAGGPKL